MLKSISCSICACLVCAFVEFAFACMFDLACEFAGEFEFARAIILELKCLVPSLVNQLPIEQQFVKVPAMMNKLLDEAETQIRTRYFIEGLMFEEPNITEVKAYAMYFCKKRCMVREVVAMK